MLSRETALAYADGGECPARDFGCLFEPWGNCTDAAAGGDGGGGGGAGGPAPAAAFPYQPVAGLLASLDPAAAAVPPAYRRRGAFWWRLAAVAHL